MLIPVAVAIFGIVIMAIGWNIMVSPGDTIPQGLTFGAIGFFVFLFAMFLAIIGT